MLKAWDAPNDTFTDLTFFSGSLYAKFREDSAYRLTLLARPAAS